MKILRKILIGVVCWAAIVGFVVYETYSIVKKEYVRQTEVAEEAREGINFNLDMIKIGVLTGDVETYDNNLAGMRGQMAVISSLGLLRNELEEYLGALSEYAELLQSKKELLKEMQTAKAEIATVKEKMKENYSDKETLTRDKLKEVKDKVLGFKIKVEDFTEEKILKVVNTVNETLDGMAEKAAALTDCIDECYKDKIVTINDELADKIKTFSDAVAGLNLDYEKEFDFEKMSELRQ